MEWEGQRVRTPRCGGEELLDRERVRKNGWWIESFNRLTVARADQAEGLSTNRDDEPLAPKRGHFRC